MSAPMSPEEIRRQMRERFDAVNAEAVQTKARREATGSGEQPENLRGASTETELPESSAPSDTSSPDA